MVIGPFLSKKSTICSVLMASAFTLSTFFQYLCLIFSHKKLRIRSSFSLYISLLTVSALLRQCHGEAGSMPASFRLTLLRQVFYRADLAVVCFCWVRRKYMLLAASLSFPNITIYIIGMYHCLRALTICNSKLGFFYLII